MVCQRNASGREMRQDSSAAHAWHVVGEGSALALPPSHRRLLSLWLLLLRLLLLALKCQLQWRPTRRRRCCSVRCCCRVPGPALQLRQQRLQVGSLHFRGRARRPAQQVYGRLRLAQPAVQRGLRHPAAHSQLVCRRRERARGCSADVRVAGPAAGLRRAPAGRHCVRPAALQAHPIARRLPPCGTHPAPPRSRPAGASPRRRQTRSARATARPAAAG